MRQIALHLPPLALIAALIALAGCADAFDRPATIPGGKPLWQNSPANATYEAPGSRPP